MDEQEKQDKIKTYIGQIQQLLTKAISESKEFKELKKLIGSDDDKDMNFCIFSVMMDKNSADFFKEMDFSTLQKMIMDSQNMQAEYEEFSPLGQSEWTDDDKDFLKEIKIII